MRNALAEFEKARHQSLITFLRHSYDRALETEVRFTQKYHVASRSAWI
jgi:hypothetical protein